MSAMRIGLLPVILAALIALPGCHYVPTPPRPTLTGPNSGWTNAPTAFTLKFTHHSGNWMTEAFFDWGDSSRSCEYNYLDEPIPHVYTKPGTYLAKCQMQNLYVDEFTSIYKLGDWSKPCTVHIVSGDSRTLRGRTRD
jgi:hypothetical protein